MKVRIVSDLIALLATVKDGTPIMWWIPDAQDHADDYQLTSVRCDDDLITLTLTIPPGRGLVVTHDGWHQARAA